MPHKPLVSKIRVHNPNKKGTAVANRNYVTYIATREGVALDGINNIDNLLENEKILQSKLNENVVHQEASNEGYVRYMAKRPRSHGLFGNIDTDDLTQVAHDVSELSKQGKIIYRGIISLSKEDGEELGLKNTDAWNNYLRRVMPDIAEKLGVSPVDHTWIAAFHAEENHPHVHYELWDNRDKVKSPFIHVSVQKAIRQMLSDEMFDDNYERTIRDLYQEELKELKENKNKERSEILEQSKNLLHEVGYVPGVEYEKLPDKIKNEDLKKIAAEANKLIELLPTNGRLTYKFLPPEAKEQLTKLTNIILDRPDMQREIQKYLSTIENMHSYYGETKTDINNAKAMGKADIEKRVKNSILKELKNCILEYTETGKENIEQKLPENMMDIKDEAVEKILINDEIEHYYFIDWNADYKEAMSLLYGEETDIEQAFDILENQSIKGNAIAIEKTAKLLEKELIDDRAQEGEEYYTEARKAFFKIYQDESLAGNDYIKKYAAYREGKLFDMGKGGDQDFKQAEKWYKLAEDNKYAMYSLAKMYLDNKVSLSSDGSMEKNYEKAIKLFQKSADMGNAFASYELGNMYSKGLGVKNDSEKADENYKIAYDKFCSMSKNTTDDNLLYRVGKMTYLGIGTEQDVEGSIPFFEKSAAVGNENAQLMLAKIYLKQDDPIKEKTAINMLEKLSNNENSMAEYNLGVIYADPESGHYDMEKALECLGRSAEQGNQFAEYRLGVIHADPESGHYDMEKALECLGRSAEQGNQFAEYKLGVIHADPESGHYDMEKALECLGRSAEQGNQFAEYKLGVIHADPESGHYDMEKALECLGRSAEQGNQFAEYKLGAIHADPKSGYYNMGKAIKYLESSAQKGYAHSQAKLGYIYYFGKGVDKNKTLGEQWLKEAAAQGNKFAEDILKPAPISADFGLSYVLVKAALESIETLNQQNINKQNDLSNTQSKQAMKEIKKHKKNREDDFVPEIG